MSDEPSVEEEKIDAIVETETRLQRWALTAEIIGAIAIVVSLVFVGFQLKESARATKSATANDAHALTISWYTALGNSDSSSDLFFRFITDFDSLSQQESFQAVMLIHAAILSFQNSYYLVEEGSLDERIRNTILEAIVVIKDTDGWKYYWENRRPLFFPEFQNYVDELMKVDRKVSQSIYKIAEE